jgi:ribonuclease BN (tRNA processing enzyme)
MEIKFLGAHNVQSADVAFTCVLIDNTIAVDAGSLVHGLTFDELKKLKGVLLTHAHFDHMRDIPAVGMAIAQMKLSLDIYGSQSVYDSLMTYMLNDGIYIDFTKRPEKDPTLRVHIIEAGKKENVAGYEVLPVKVEHSKPATGFQVTSPEGKKVFVTSDTGPGLTDAWKQIKPDLLVTEVTVPNSEDEFAHKAGHLTPKLLQQELESFKNIRNYLPKVVLMHMSPFGEKEIREELKDVEKALEIKLIVAREGMRIKV